MKSSTKDTNTAPKDAVKAKKPQPNRKLAPGKLLVWWSACVRDNSLPINSRLRASQLLAMAYNMLSPESSKEDSSIRDAVNKISKMSMEELKKKTKDILESKEPVADAINEADDDADE